LKYNNSTESPQKCLSKPKVDSCNISEPQKSDQLKEKSIAKTNKKKDLYNMVVRIPTSSYINGEWPEEPILEPCQNNSISTGVRLNPYLQPPKRRKTMYAVSFGEP